MATDGSMRADALRAPPAPAAASFRFAGLPLLLLMTYLGATLLFFLAWPINWPIYSTGEWVTLTLYLLVCFGAIAVAYRLGVRRDYLPLKPFDHTRLVIIAGAIFAAVLLFPSAYIYTGRWPWQVLEVLQEQGTAYTDLQYQLLETAGERGPIAFVRALFAPLTFAVIPLGIVNWRRIGNIARLGVLAAGGAAVIFSLLRGTDREFADLFAIGVASLLVAMARTSGGAVALVRRYWKPALLVALFVWTAASLYTDRKSERVGGFDQRSSVCANVSGICAELDAPLISWMPLAQRFGISFFVLSTSSGYYGLKLALEKDFQSTFGFGHSPAAQSIYELVTGDESLATRTYTYKNGIDGWHEEYYWSSLVTWIANDVGFFGAVLVLALAGFLWGRAWRDATVGGSDQAAVVFCFLTILFVYLPANNQVFAGYDGYATFAAWLFLWARQRTAGAAPAAPAR